MFTKLKAALDRLPTALRDFVVGAAATGVGLVLQAVVGAGGVTGVDWPDVLLGAVNAAAVAGATVGLLAVTPLTAAYGVGKVKPKTIPPEPGADGDVDEESKALA